MLRKDSSRIYIVLMLIFCINLIGCEASNDNVEITPPARPANVPKEAIWSGGMDGGVFIYIKKSENAPSNIYSAEIYYDTTGEIWYKGRLSLEASENKIFDFNDKDVYAGWDGDTLYLRDGRMLKAIDSIE